MKKIIPCYDQVLVRRLKPETQSKIAKPDGYQDSKYALGEVMAVGPGNKNTEAPCKVEDVVLFLLSNDRADANPVSIIEGYGDCAMIGFHQIFAVIE